jgi:hypothetical protein
MTNNLSTAQYAAILGRLKAVKNGPIPQNGPLQWEMDAQNSFQVMNGDDEQIALLMFDHENSDQRIQARLYAELFASSMTDIEALLDEVVRLRPELARAGE